MRRVIVLLCLISVSLAASNESPRVDNEKEIVSFVYHRFGDDRFPSTNISLKDFEAHLNYLTQSGYQLLTLSDAINYLTDDRPSQKTAVITIDDGYKSFFKNGLPILKKYKAPATLFINTETIGGNDYMDWSQLKTVMKSNVEIGNHTHSHAYFLNHEIPERYALLREELKLSQSLIEKHLGVIPEVFAYPYGEFDPTMKSIVKQAGFIAATAQNSGVIQGGSDLFQLPRFPMSEAYASIDQFKSKAMMQPLAVTKEDPESFLLENQDPPVLTLTIDARRLNLKQLQCFVQGGTCIVKTQQHSEDNVTLILKSKEKLSKRRRTLYTVTIPDTEGNWHWYSHLWINPTIH